MPALTIEDRTATGRPTGTGITLPDLPDRITLRELIRTRVREEVARYNLQPLAMFRGLVQPDESDATSDGYRMHRARPLDWQRQADVAIRSFERNGFFVLVDRKPSRQRRLLHVNGAVVGGLSDSYRSPASLSRKLLELGLEP